MTYAFTYEVPITAEIYARIKEGIGPQRPPGLIAHLAYRTESGLRYVEVWQAKDDWEAFEHDRGCIPSSTRCCRTCSASCPPSPRAPCSTSSTPGPPSTPRRRDTGSAPAHLVIGNDRLGLPLRVNGAAIPGIWPGSDPGITRP